MKSSKRQKTLLHFFAAPPVQQPCSKLRTNNTETAQGPACKADTATQSEDLQLNCQHHADHQLQPILHGWKDSQVGIKSAPVLTRAHPCDNSTLCTQQQTASSTQSPILQPSTLHSPPVQPACLLSPSAMHACSPYDDEESDQALSPLSCKTEADQDAGAPAMNEYEQQVDF